MKQNFKTTYKFLYLGALIFGLWLVVFNFSKTTISPNALAQETSPDAIAIRVIPNPDHYSARRWYYEQGFTGSPKSLTVDGYEAAQDGRTVYVNAANVIGDELYTNIYLISYNQKAESVTIDIFEEILKRWKFNTNIVGDGNCSQTTEIICSANTDCPGSEYCTSPKAKIIRDIKRLADLGEVKRSLEAYKLTYGYYPKLKSGTYLPNKTISTWPSWQETLAEELGMGLPIDPVNELGDCPNYDSITCWNEDNKEFAGSVSGEIIELPTDSYALVYSAASDGSSYNICGIMESGLITTLAEGACAGSESVQYGRDTDNNPPSVTCGNLVGFPNVEFIGYVSANDPDGDLLTLSIIDTPGTTWTGWSAAPVLKNTANPNQKEVYANQAGGEGTYNIFVTATDNKGGTKIKHCTITISSSGPVVTPITDQEIVIGNTLDFMVYASDPGGNYPLSFIFTPSLSCAVVGNEHDCKVQHFIDGSSFPASTDSGSYMYDDYIISVEAVNSLSVSSPSQSFILKVINHKPDISPLACDTEIRINSSYNCSVAATDLNGHNIVSFSFSGLPTGINGNTSTGEISGTPTVAGSYNISITATDEYGAISNSKSYTLKINTYCGDGTRQSINNEGVSEECDDPDNIASSPTDSAIDRQYGCNSDCQFIGGYCGDEVAQDGYGEECDGDNLNGKDCVTAYPDQFIGGTLGCSSNCGFDASQCIIPYILSGNIKEALTGNDMSGVSISVQDQAGTEFGLGATDDSGDFTINDLASNSDYKIVISKANFKEGGKNHYSLSGDQSIQLYMLPESWTGVMAIILRWGATPADLDSHLIFGGAHVWYDNKTDNGAQLDLDNTTHSAINLGPETITIMAPVVGIDYQYYVQDYTHCYDDTTGSGATTAGANVQIWNKNAELVREYSSPGAGCRWYIFNNMTIDVNGNITIP